MLQATAAMITFSAFTALTFYLLREQILTFLHSIADLVSRNGAAGVLLFAMLIILASFPPVAGYSILLTLCGFIYGVWWGFVLNYLSALCGAVVCFSVSRRLYTSGRGPPSKCCTSTRYIRLLHSISLYLEHNKKDTAKFLLLLRLAPFPFTLLNVVLAHVSSVSLRQFTFITGASLLKVILHAWVGASITDLADILNVGTSSPKTPAHIVELVMLGVASSVAVIGGFYMYNIVTNALMQFDSVHSSDAELFLDGDVDNDYEMAFGDELVDLEA